MVGGQARIQGKVFKDHNANGINDEGDEDAAKASVTHTGPDGKQTIVQAGPTGLYEFDVLPGAGGLSSVSGAFVPAQPVILINPEPGDTLNLDIPLIQGDPLPPTPAIGLHPGLINPVGAPQTWLIWQDGILQETQDLINWRSLPDAKPPFLINPETFGVSSPAPLGCYRIIKIPE